MDFFDKLSDTLVSATKEVGQKAKDVSGIAKLQYDIKCKEDDLEKLYADLGRKYYQIKKEEPAEDEAAAFDEIDELTAALADLKEQLIDLKGAKSCPKCGAKVADNATFCSSCGAKLDDMFEEED